MGVRHMGREFILTPIFQKLWKKAELGKDTLLELQQELLEHPDKGVVIPGTNGLRKIRIPASGRGKRGGGRVFYKDFVVKNKIYFLFLVIKNEKEDLTQEQKKQVAATIKEIEKELNNERK